MAIGPMDAKMHRALVEQEQLIEARVPAILNMAMQSKEVWATALGAPKGVWRSRLNRGGLP